MTLLAPPPLREGPDAEALIKEARRLRRRRWLIGTSLMVLVIVERDGCHHVVVTPRTIVPGFDLRGAPVVAPRKSAPRPIDPRLAGGIPRNHERRKTDGAHSHRSRERHPPWCAAILQQHLGDVPVDRQRRRSRSRQRPPRHRDNPAGRDCCRLLADTRAVDPDAR